jgi:hypothetical protein
MAIRVQSTGVERVPEGNCGLLAIAVSADFDVACHTQGTCKGGLRAMFSVIHGKSMRLLTRV